MIAARNRDATRDRRAPIPSQRLSESAFAADRESVTVGLLSPRLRWGHRDTVTVTESRLPTAPGPSGGPHSRARDWQPGRAAHWQPAGDSAAGESR